MVATLKHVVGGHRSDKYPHVDDVHHADDAGTIEPVWSRHGHL